MGIAIKFMYKQLSVNEEKVMKRKLHSTAKKPLLNYVNYLLYCVAVKIVKYIVEVRQILKKCTENNMHR